MPKDKINFLILGAVSEILYLSLFLVEPARRIIHDYGLVLGVNSILTKLSVIILATFLLYALACRIVDFNKVPLRLIIGFGMVLTITTSLLWPTSSKDLFSYISQARITSVYNQNPYSTSYSNFSNDAFYPILKNDWSWFPVVYGPVFTILGIIITKIAGNNLLLNVYLFKLIFLIFNIANIYLILKLTANKKSVFLYAFNPLVIHELSINSHTESLLIMFLLISLLIIKHGKSTVHFLVSLLSLTLSVLIKYSTFVIVPFYLVYIFKKFKKRRELFYFASLAAILISATTAVFFMSFIDNINLLGNLVDVAQAFTFHTSLGITIILFILYKLGLSRPYEASLIISRIIFFITTTLIFIGYLKLELTKRRTKDVGSFKQLILFLLLTLVVYYATFFNWFFAWYMTPLIAILTLYQAMSKNAFLVFYTNLITIYGIFLTMVIAR